MNRRTFLKSTVVATIGVPIGLPTLVKAKEKQQWISLREQFPKEGQQIVMLGVWEGMSTNLRIGRVNGIHRLLENSKYLGKYLLLQVDFSLCRHDYNGPLNGHYDLILNRNSANYSAREILNTSWVKTKIVTDMSMGPMPFYIKSSIKQYWIPAPDRIPSTLPPIPFNRPYVFGEAK